MTNDQMDIGLVRRWFDAVDAKNGIGEEMYLAVSQLVPSANMEFLIRSEDRTSTLLTWRADQYYGPGWHVPGGVIRFKEEMKDRIEKVVRRELDRELASIEGPIGFHEMFNHTRNIKGHFLSFMFKVTLAEPPNEGRKAGDEPKDGAWRWFDHCPDNLISNQCQLRGYL